MRLFWRRDQDPVDNSRCRSQHPAHRGTRGPAPAPIDENKPVADVAVSDRDWDEISSFLAGYEPRVAPSSAPAERLGMLASALAELRRSIDGQIMPAGPVIDRLLDFWGLVHLVEPELAKPVESLLSALVGRDMVSRREVAATCDLVEAALEQIAGVRGMRRL